MLTYTGMRNLFGTLANNNSSATLTVADTLINQCVSNTLSMRDWPFRYREKTILTVASQHGYDIPQTVERVVAVKVTIGSTAYVCKESSSADHWGKLNQMLYKSNIPVWWRAFNDKVELWPVPSSAGNTLTLTARVKQGELSAADYVTGTVISVANGGTAVVGSGTTWTAAMVGRYLNIPLAQGGDGMWYEIAAVGSTTGLTLVKPYQGASLAAASATYTIGQSTLIPEDFQQVPVYQALQLYYTSIQPENDRAQLYGLLAKDNLQRMIDSAFKNTGGVVIREDYTGIANPNLFIYQ
jgi:hypothetical protein